MSRAGTGSDRPRAMVHRRILDVASERPDASIPAIADAVSGASPELVERVLEEYGDPATDLGDEPEDAESESNPNGDDDSAGAADSATSGDAVDTETEAEAEAETETETVMATENGHAESIEGTDEKPTTESLSEKQRTTLRLVAERPDATQQAIADELGVTRATVSRRLNDIPGFEWDEREYFVSQQFDGVDGESKVNEQSEPGDATGDTTATDDSDDRDDSSSATASDEQESRDDAIATAIEELDQRVASLEGLDQRVASLEADDSSEAEADDSADLDLPPDIAHKVVHACMESDRLTEDEELQVLRALMEQ